VLSSLLTGVLGLQPRPSVVEAVVWLLYAVPMLVYVSWPRRGRRPAALPAPDGTAADSGPAATAERAHSNAG
jgi:high-affinity iron transporter